MGIPFYKVIVGSLSILIAYYAKKYEDIDKAEVLPENPNDFLLPDPKEYDYIVVGAGSAGSVVANRLSKHFTVLLLEAGGNPIPQTYVPSNFPYVVQNPDTAYHWNSVQQTNACLNDNGICKTEAGRFLGGSSVINNLMYNRGNPKDYDNWANLTGDDSWNYTNVLKFFKMTEDFYEYENCMGNDDCELGVGGPFSIRQGGVEGKLVYDAFIDSGKELGYNFLNNSNNPQREGFTPLSEALSPFGRRVSTYDAFIKPILDRKTLTISRYSIVSTIDIDEHNRSVGVYYTRHGILTYAKAKREIILSAGAMNSPQILLRSGVGPAQHLNSLGIPVKADLPVGQNFQDHPISHLRAKFDNPSLVPFTNITQEDVNHFLNSGKGPLSISYGKLAQAFIVSSVAKSNGNEDWPDILLIFRVDSAFHHPDGKNSLEIFALLAQVLSRGSLTLNPNDVNGPPIWDPKWLTHEQDLTILAEALKLIDTIFKSKPFKDLGVTVEKPVIPGCLSLEYGTDEYWKCHVRHITRSARHPTATCKMGRRNDPTTVVDTKLRVHGIKGLRVIDNSIQPTVTNANTNAPAIMIGQHGAHMILGSRSTSTQ